MPKYLIKASYTDDGVRRLMVDGGTKRRTVIKEIIESMGGTVEAFYFAFGKHDAFIIADVPDVATGLTISLSVNASGFVRIATIPLITPEEVDAATK